ncbi:MAG: ABC transporter permease [Lentisphaerae bacterium]|nr:ABC transporter permease [Lentisphaerota bacterium]
MAIGVAAGSGLICGLLNGFLVVFLRIHPFIVTMGTLSIFRGLALISVPVKSLPAQGRELPHALTAFMGYRLTLPFDWTLFGYTLVEKGTFINPVPMLIMLSCVLCAWVYLEHRVGGRELFAVGGNEEAARFSGLPVERIKLRVYALSGLMGGIAGFVSAGHYGSANTATGLGYELNVIAAAVVGGASMTGGRGSAFGAMLGALVIKLIENGIDVIQVVNLGFLKLRVSQEYGKIIIGAAIIVAVSVDRLSMYLRQRQRRPELEPKPENQP